jgi:FdhE protein
MPAMGPATQATAAANWTRRAERARDLQTDFPAAADLLRFYAEVLAFQGRVAASARAIADVNLPLRGQIDLDLALRSLPGLLTTVRKHGPAPLAEAASRLQQRPEAWHDIFSVGTDASAGSSDAENRDPATDFFARATLQPIAEHLQSQYPEATDQTARQCPVCGCLPQVVILRPEGEGARRSLLCSFCLREWAFRRVLCAYCGELDKLKLPYYTADECKHVRVEACDTCHRYLKSVDLSLDGLAIPLVDELALAALDLWASERGYAKITPNLLGL